MKIGVTGHLGQLDARAMEVAKTVEALGFESFWTGEHIFVPVQIADPLRHGLPLPENYKHMADVFITLTAFAAVTTKLKLGTDVVLVPQRNPLILAKEVATLDRISGGRFIFGIGSGWIEEEAQIMHVPFKQRVRMTNEYLRALKVLWAEETPSFSGEFISFPSVHSNPKPWQKPHPPILIGAGNWNTDNSAVLKRVAQIADGWLPIALSPEQMRAQLKQLKEHCDANGRDFGKLDISLIVSETSFRNRETQPSAAGVATSPSDLIAQYRDAGVTRLIVQSNGDLVERVASGKLERLAKTLGLRGA